MSSLMLRALDPAGLRTTSSFSAVFAESLPEPIADSYGAFLKSSGAIGLLLPSRVEDPPIPIRQDTAVALAAVGGPIPVPPDAGALETTAVQRELAWLVLEGVVEVEGPDGFLSGHSAYGHIVEEGPGQDPRSSTSHLSLKALRFAQALLIPDPRLLARRLYSFNSLPASLRRLRRLGGSAGLRALHKPDPADPHPAPGWIRDPAGGLEQGWIVWQRSPVTERPSADEVSYKLYISPRPEDLPGVVAVSLPILANTGALAIKAASAVSQTLRPDKMVAYFSGLEKLRHAAYELLPALAGTRAQGVPFSVGLDDEGLLSWGIDPPESCSPETGRSRSWRGWITRELARALADVGVGCNDPEPWEFALTCLALLGVDDETFAPPQEWRDLHLS